MSGLKDKLYNYEQTPPPKAWEKIVAALDESHLDDQFPSKLYNAEITPPASAWDKIAGALAPEEAPVVPVRHNAFPFVRYAAAAVLIGIVAFSVFRLTSSNHADKENGLANADTAKKAGRPNDNVEVKPIEKTESNHEEVIAAVTTPDARTQSVKRKRNAAYTISDDINSSEPIYAYNDYTPNLADRYFMLMTPDGGIIRMSKKWGHLVCCVSGQEQDESCKDQLKKWQEKIACSPANNSSGNFMDVLSLVNELNEPGL